MRIARTHTHRQWLARSIGARPHESSGGTDIETKRSNVRVSARTSAGILLYRTRSGVLEVFLVHPGGPYWAAKDDGAWSIPKGEFEGPEAALPAAQREFQEETGSTVNGPFEALTPVRTRGGKWIRAWATKGELDPATLKSNLFSIEWPPRSGRTQSFPEVDRGDWFGLDEARVKISAGQLPLLEELATLLARQGSARPES
jgi:predicted NUDIX family NTP pyrophosphohydrolase